MLLMLHSLPDPGHRRSPWGSVVRYLGQGHRDGHPLMHVAAMSGAVAVAASSRLPQRVRHATACRPLKGTVKVHQRASNLSEPCVVVVVVVVLTVRLMTCLCRYAIMHAINSGARSPGSQTPGDPGTPSPP